MVVFVDYQSFLNSDKDGTIIKELAILNTEKSNIDYFLFKPPEDLPNLPHNFQEQIDWVTRNLHGLSWCDGSESYSKVDTILAETTKNIERVYVKGKRKKKILEQRMPTKTVIDVQQHSCPSFRELNALYNNRTCKNHTHKVKCSLSNVQNLSSWYNEHCAAGKLPSQNCKIGQISLCCFC